MKSTLPDRRARVLLFAVTLCATLHAPLSPCLAQGTAFTYQGRLDDNGAPYTGNAEFQPTLWDADTGGTKLADNNPNFVEVAVTNGLFVLPLDFGTAFPGAKRWLQLEVRTTIGPFNLLSPRQPLTPTPYAITAGGVSGPVPTAQLTGTLPSANLGGSYSSALTLNNPANSFTGSGAGLTALNASQLTTGTVPDARLAANVARTNQVWLLGGNAGTTPGVNFLGTTDNQPLELRVNNLRALRLEPTANDVDGSNLVNVIAGSPVNTVGTGVRGATISGGGAANWLGAARTNRVDADFGTIGGGLQHTIQPDARYATIGGGLGNTILTESRYATIGGGYFNTIETNADAATIGGGRQNTIQPNAAYATISGGSANTIQPNAAYATIPGGQSNSATNYAFAGGRRAKANYTGSFVWGDSTDADIASTNVNSVTFRAAGGYRLFSNSGATAGVSLAPGGTAWAVISDRNLKKDFAPVDGVEVLEKLAALPITRWHYAWESAEATPHLGPMAQDFKAAFYPGADDKVISTQDADGVALAAIQGLNAKVESGKQKAEADLAELREQLHRRDAENAELKARLEQKGTVITELRVRLEKLEQLLTEKLSGGAQ
jgi:hypothetical protein